MSRIIFVDHMGDRREIRIGTDNMAETFFNEKATGKLHLHDDEVEAILSAETEDAAFSVVQALIDCEMEKK